MSGIGFDDFGEATEGVVVIFVEDAIEYAGLQFAVGTPDIADVFDFFTFGVEGDEGFRVAVRIFVMDDPAVEETFGGELEGCLVVVIPDFGDVVDGDLGVAVEKVVFVVGFLEEGGGGTDQCRVISEQRRGRRF